MIALVPARGGSKGVALKNIRLLGGKPLLSYSLDAARSCDIIDKIVLSTDSKEILSFGRLWGVHTHARSQYASTDLATAADVVLEFLGNYQESPPYFDDYMVYLQPTSPFRSSIHIASAFALMEEMKVDACTSVVRLLRSPRKAFELNPQGLLQPLFDKFEANANRQSLPTAYYPNGAIYIFKISQFISIGGFPSNLSAPFEMSPEESLDIDSESDLSLAESYVPRINDW